MNRILITTIISILSISSLQAQNNRYDWGIEGGPNFSTLLVPDNPFIETGFSVFGSGGFIFQYNTKKILSFKTGFSFQRKGCQINGLTFVDETGNFISEGKIISRLDYVTLPFLVKATFGKNVKFFVNAGPYGGFLLAQSDRTKIGDKNEVSNNNLSGLNRWDFGFAGGIGIAIPIKEFWQISVEARNYSGILDLNSGGGSRIYTNTTDLRVGVVYKLGFRDSE